MTDLFVDWIKRSRSDKGETVSGRMVETRSQKTSEERKELLEVEVNTDHTMNDNQEVNGLEGRGRRLASESTPVEQGHDFATSTGTLDREEMSELSDISTEVTATRRSPTDNTMMAGGTGKQTTSSSFSERMKNTFGNIFPFSMGGGAGNDGESQEEEDEEGQGDFGSQVSLNSSIQENEAHVGRETGTMDKFGVVTTISKEANTPGQSKDFAIRTSSEPQPGESRTRGLGNALVDPEVDNEKTLKQRVKARVSTSTKLPGTDRVTPPLVTPLVDNGAALEEALNNIVDSLGEQNEQMSELERAVHIERESLWEEINRNRQEVGRSEKRLKERTDEHMAKNLSRMTREAEQRELRLRADMEKLRIQQEQSLGTLDTKIDAMMERRTQAIMDRLDGLLSSKSGPKEGEPNSNIKAGRRMDPLEAGAVHQAMPQGVMQHGARTVEQVQRGTDKPLTNDQRKAHMRLGEVIPATGGMQARGGVMWAKREALTVMRIAGMHRTQSLRRGVRTLKRDTQGMLRQWPQHLNP